MSRTRALTIVGAFLLALAVPRARAGAQEILPPDSTPSAARLSPVVVTGETNEHKRKGLLARLGLRSRVSELERGNRALERQIEVYDRRIAQLEAHLDSLKTVVTDSMLRSIATIDSATTQVRTRRLALEARLRELEKKDSARKQPVYGAGVP